jgi:uncharacterized protein YkwD
MNAVSQSTHDHRRAHRGAVLAALVLVIALLGTLVHPGSAAARTTLPPRTVVEITFATAVEKLLNTERALNHLKPLTSNARLMTSARSHNVAMATTNTMAHQVRGEQGLGSRITAAGYKWSWAGENIGWNSAMTAAGVLLLQKAMFNERPPNDGHRLNILNSHFTNVGVDVYLDTTHHKVWLTTDFGRP